MNALARVSIIAGVILLAAAGAFGYLFIRSPYMTGQNVVREQPVPFSHEHHVTGLGIDCRYCHFSADKSSFAGIPPTKVCMNCHTQIWADSPMLEPVRESFRTDKPIEWTRVHRLPDHVYFNHSIHVNKGVGCTSCHGDIDKMPLVRQANSLLMSWCLDCHRYPEQQVRPREKVYDFSYTPPDSQEELGAELVKEYSIQSRTHCSACHR